MQFDFQKGPLLKTLRNVGMVINHSTVLPILEDFIFYLSGSDLTVAATDLENYIESKLEFQSGKDLKDAVFCIPAKSLLDFLSVVPCDDLKMEVNMNTRLCSFVFNEGKTTFEMDDANNFPVRPELKDEEIVEIGVQGSDLLPILKEALDYVSNDDLRPAMTGVWFGKYKDAVHVVATDAHRLIFKKLVDVNSPGMTPENWRKYSDMIAPKKAMQIVSKIFPKNEQFSLKQDKSHCSLICDSYTLISRLIDAKYPNWPVVVPQLDHHFILQKKEFAAIASFFAKMSNPTTRQINLFLKKDKLKVYVDCKSNEFGLADAEINMSVYKNTIEDEFEFALNATFVNKMIKPKKDSLIKISHACSPTKAFIFNDESLIMPLTMNA